MAASTVISYWLLDPKTKDLLPNRPPQHITYYNLMNRRLYIKLEKIDAVAKKLAKALKGGEIFALIGPLGAGKTTFAKALGKQLKIKHKITSPTFTLLHSFPARLKSKKPIS